MGVSAVPIKLSNNCHFESLTFIMEVPWAMISFSTHFINKNHLAQINYITFTPINEPTDVNIKRSR